MDIMDTKTVNLAEKMRAASDGLQGEYDVELNRKVINLNRKHKELVSKLIDASDQRKDIIDIVLSSTNTMLDLMQKIVKTNPEELYLLRKITEFSNREWELIRKFMNLCNEDRYFVCKFMDWYLRDETFGFSCSCSTVKEVDCLLPAEGKIETQHNMSKRESKTDVSCKETEIGKPVFASGENVGTISGDKAEEDDAHLFRKESNKNISNVHDFSLMIKNKIKSISVKSCVEAEPLSLQTEVEKGKRTIPDKNTQKEASFHSEDSKVDSVNLSTISGDKVRKVLDHLSLKENKEIVTDVHSSLTIKDITDSVVEKSFSVEPEIRSECAECYDHGQESRNNKITVPDNNTQKEASFRPESAKVDSGNLSTISGDKLRKVPDYISLKESKEIVTDVQNSLTIRDITDSVPEKSCSVEPKIQSECAEPYDFVQESKNNERTVPDNKTQKETSFHPESAKVDSGNLSTISEDKLREVPDHLSLKESKEIVTDVLSSLTIKDITDSVVEKSFSVEPEIRNECAESHGHGQESRNNKITVPDNNTQKEASFRPESAKVDSGNLSTISGDKLGEAPDHLSLKESKKIITEVQNSTVTDNSTDNVKLNHEDLNKISEYKTEEADAHLPRMENKDIISNTCNSFVTARRNSNSLLKEKCLIQAEIEHDYIRSYNEQEPLQSRLRSRKRAVLDNKTENDISLPAHNTKVNNKAKRTCHEVKCKDVNSYVTFENKCKGAWSTITRNSIAEETTVFSSDSREIAKPTNEVKSSEGIKYNRMKLCMTKMEFITHGIDMFTIATSMTRFLHVNEKKTAAVLLRKARSFFTQARATYSSLEKYLTKLQRGENNRKHEKLSHCAFQMLQFMLKLQQSFSLKHTKGGVDMKVIIMDITHVMDMVAEIIMVATEKEDKLQGQRLDEEKTPLTSRLTRHKNLAIDEACSNPNEEFVLKNCCIQLEDVAHVLNGKKTVKLKDLKEPKENIMKNTITENKTLNVTNSGFNKLNNLSMKRKWGTQQRCYRNNCKKRETEISEDCVLKVPQGHEPVKLTDVNIPSDCELPESSTAGPQVSVYHESEKRSTNELQARTDNEPTHFSPNHPLASLHHESVECSTSGCNGQSVCSAIENHSENEMYITTYDMSNNGTSSVIPKVQIKQEIVDLAASHNSKDAEDSHVCGETSTDWKDVTVKDEVTIDEDPYFEDPKFGQGMKECSTFCEDSIDKPYQNFNSERLSTAFVSSEDMSEPIRLNDDYRQLQHTVPKIHVRELTSSEEGSLQSVRNMSKRSTKCMEQVKSSEGTSGEYVEQTGNMRLRVKPDFSRQTDKISGRCMFGAETEVVSEMPTALGIGVLHSSPIHLGRLEWAQYTVAFDHPYSREAEKPAFRTCHICEICRKVIHSASNVIKHMNRHFKCSAIMCNYCNKLICNFKHWTEHKQNCSVANNV